MTRGLGIVAEKNKIAYTCVSDTGQGGATVVVEEDELLTPATHQDRGAQLAWLLAEVRGLFGRMAPDAIVLQKPGMGVGRERVEVEGLVQLAAHDAGIHLRMLVREGVRARLGVPKDSGAFDRLLAETDVAARSNAAKRERYLFAKAALKL